jgi:hypothetical protein
VFFDAGAEYRLIQIYRNGSGWLLTALDKSNNVVAERSGRYIRDVWRGVKRDLRVQGVRIPPRP